MGRLARLHAQDPWRCPPPPRLICTARPHTKDALQRLSTHRGTPSTGTASCCMGSWLLRPWCSTAPHPPPLTSPRPPTPPEPPHKWMSKCSSPHPHPPTHPPIPADTPPHPPTRFPFDLTPPCSPQPQPVYTLSLPLPPHLYTPPKPPPSGRAVTRRHTTRLASHRRICTHTGPASLQARPGFPSTHQLPARKGTIMCPASHRREKKLYTHCPINSAKAFTPP
jgi:hypothetical protein